MKKLLKAYEKFIINVMKDIEKIDSMKGLGEERKILPDTPWPYPLPQLKDKDLNYLPEIESTIDFNYIKNLRAEVWKDHYFQILGIELNKDIYEGTSTHELALKSSDRLLEEFDNRFVDNEDILESKNCIIKKASALYMLGEIIKFVKSDFDYSESGFTKRILKKRLGDIKSYIKDN